MTDVGKVIQQHATASAPGVKIKTSIESIKDSLCFHKPCHVCFCFERLISCRGVDVIHCKKHGMGHSLRAT